MIRIIENINPIYEAMSYIYNKVCGYDFACLVDFVSGKNPDIRPNVCKQLEPIRKLHEILDSKISLDMDLCSKYFSKKEKEFLPFKCLARFIVEPITFYGFITDPDDLYKKLMESSPQERMNHMLASLVDDTSLPLTMSYPEFVDYILSLDMDGVSKFEIVDAFNRYENCLSDIFSLISPVAKCITENISVVEESIKKWRMHMNSIDDVTNYVYEKYGFSASNAEYCFFPSLLRIMKISIVWWQTSADTVDVQYRGDMASNIGMLICSPESSRLCVDIDRTISIIKGLSDETRFELLCSVVAEPCYGSALAEKFNMPQQKVFYHMQKLLSPCIIECNVQSGKTYYSLNRKTIWELIYALMEIAGDEEQ